MPRRTAKPPAEKKETNYITPAGFRRLADELTFLHTKKRPEVVSALSDAAAELHHACRLQTAGG